MVERITSRRSTLRTLPALREEALPRPRAQRMCRGVHTESSAGRSEMGKIDRSRRRRGCAGALRHKICTASLDNRPLIDGFVLPARYRLDSSQAWICQRLTPEANWLRFGAFRSPPAPPSASLTTGRYPLAPHPTLHAPRSSGSAVDAARRAGYSTPLPAEGQHATKCYVFRFFAEVFGAMFSAQVNII